MSQKTIILIVVLFALLVLGMFVYAHLKQTELQSSTPNTNDQTTTEPVESSYPNIDRIDATHYYIDGEHTIVGEIIFPTPCDLLETGVMVAESYPEQVSFNFEVINNADMCAEVVTAQRFKISVTASEEAELAATFMGQPIPLNLRPAPEGETPDDFELFIKG